MQTEYSLFKSVNCST